MNTIIESLLSGSNYPPEGSIAFISSDHIRFQNGQDVSGHNNGSNRKLVIEKDIEGGEGYSVTMYNLDGNHSFWQNNIQMATKRMRVVNIQNNIVQLRGFGVDQFGTPFSDYGVDLLIEDSQISRVQLNMFDRNVSIVYLP